MIALVTGGGGFIGRAICSRLHERGDEVRSFSRSPHDELEAMARRCLEMGMYISFAGMVTFKKSNDLRDVARSIPDDRILIETDAPYLSPHPKRGQRPNEPALLVHTARCLAEVRESSPEQFAQISTENACRLFGLDG